MTSARFATTGTNITCGIGSTASPPLAVSASSSSHAAKAKRFARHLYSSSNGDIVKSSWSPLVSPRATSVTLDSFIMSGTTDYLFCVRMSTEIGELSLSKVQKQLSHFYLFSIYLSRGSKMRKGCFSVWGCWMSDLFVISCCRWGSGVYSPGREWCGVWTGSGRIRTAGMGGEGR